MIRRTFLGSVFGSLAGLLGLRRTEGGVRLPLREGRFSHYRLIPPEIKYVKTNSLGIEPTASGSFRGSLDVFGVVESSDDPKRALALRREFMRPRSVAGCRVRPTLVQIDHLLHHYCKVRWVAEFEEV